VDIGHDAHVMVDANAPLLLAHLGA
jgi:hypothetical protein